MPISPVRVVQAYLSVSYDGINGDDIATAIPNTSVVSDTGAVLTLNYLGIQELVLNVGDWILWRESGTNVNLLGTYSDALYQQHFAPLPA